LHLRFQGHPERSILMRAALVLEIAAEDCAAFLWNGGWSIG
jgi:hypothetical protein